MAAGWKTSGRPPAQFERPLQELAGRPLARLGFEGETPSWQAGRLPHYFAQDALMAGERPAPLFHIAVLAKPLDRLGQGLFGRGLRQAEFEDGFGRVEEHLVSGHAHARQGRSGRSAREA